MQRQALVGALINNEQKTSKSITSATGKLEKDVNLSSGVCAKTPVKLEPDIMGYVAAAKRKEHQMFGELSLKDVNECISNAAIKLEPELIISNDIDEDINPETSFDAVHGAGPDAAKEDANVDNSRQSINEKYSEEKNTAIKRYREQLRKDPQKLAEYRAKDVERKRKYRQRLLELTKNDEKLLKERREKDRIRQKRNRDKKKNEAEILKKVESVLPTDLKDKVKIIEILHKKYVKSKIDVKHRTNDNLEFEQ